MCLVHPLCVLHENVRRPIDFDEGPKQRLLELMLPLRPRSVYVFANGEKAITRGEVFEGDAEPQVGELVADESSHC